MQRIHFGCRALGVAITTELGESADLRFDKMALPCRKI
jgi:hypothetical protein